ncbi:DUF6236 family protein [Teredinibacter turnerae]|uniref:DUF6236 family protein n=1 Tax=Teredinibacter turnerae TaxID=2426 RepID=UPI000374AA6B|nr:DUF6236 family protein [Teredinibacter turnerae]
MEKGIIAAPACVSGDGAKFRTEGGLTQEDLRYFLLYWDKVVIPTNNIVHLRVPEEDELLSTGIVTRPRVPFSGAFNGELIARAQLIAQTSIAKNLIENDRNIDWVLHQIGDEIIIPDKESVEKQLIRIDLVNCLPVPSGDAHIPDILEFKERRKDELECLHKSIDDLYMEVLGSPDPSLRTKQAVSEFQKSIAAIDQVSKESWESFGKFDLSAELNLNGKDVAAGIAAGAAFDFFTSLYTVPIGAIVGAVASTIKVKAKSAKTFEPSKEKQVLGYIASAHVEKILIK